MNTARGPIEQLLAAIESRDLRRIGSMLTPGATWQNVPQPAADGRDAVVELLAGILRWSDQVRWDIVSAAYDDRAGWVERIDRFWIDGTEHAVRCHGVFDVDPGTGLVSAVRDYVDLGEWRARIVPVYERLVARPPERVVARHLDAVRRREPVAMAADYALDAMLVRGDHEHHGWTAVADYFDTVPRRLGERRLELGPPEPSTDDASTVEVAWVIHDGDRTIASGRDTYEVAAGWIIRHVVALDGDDF